MSNSAEIIVVHATANAVNCNKMFTEAEKTDTFRDVINCIHNHFHFSRISISVLPVPLPS